MEIEFTDPLGFKHYVLFTKNKIFGAENLAHCVADNRIGLVNFLISAVMTSSAASGEVEGYMWQRIS